MYNVVQSSFEYYYLTVTVGSAAEPSKSYIIIFYGHGFRLVLGKIHCIIQLKHYIYVLKYNSIAI